MTPQKRNRILKAFIRIYDDPKAEISALRKRWIRFCVLGFACVMISALVHQEDAEVILLIFGGIFLGMSVVLSGAVVQIPLIAEYTTPNRDAISQALNEE